MLFWKVLTEINLLVLPILRQWGAIRGRETEVSVSRTRKNAALTSLRGIFTRLYPFGVVSRAFLLQSQHASVDPFQAAA